MDIYQDFDLTDVTTFHLPVRASRYVRYYSVDELRQALADYGDGRVMAVGEGSNLLFARDYDGTLLRSAIGYMREVSRDGDEVVVAAGSGVDWDTFVSWCVTRGYHGVENLSLIPGTVGASAVQNVGAYGVEAKDVICGVTTVEVTTGIMRHWDVTECCYGYRDSVFKHPDNAGRYIVTEVCYRLSLRPRFVLDYGPLRELADVAGLTAADVRERVIAIRRAKLPDPSETGSAGSFFKNPVVSPDFFAALCRHYGDMPHYDVADGVKIPAGWLIEHAGMKGATAGGAQVYPLQSLVIVNRGDATPGDVLALMGKVRGRVAMKYHILLQPEVNIIGRPATMSLTFLGTGTSTGVPQIGCDCEVCTSDDRRDRRTRTSALLSVGERSLLIDCGPDFREQILATGSPWIDALLVTHSHYDHVGGVDDLRPYCAAGEGLPVYCREDVASDLHTRLPYCFSSHPYPGVPKFDIHTVGDAPFTIGDIEVTPLPVMHYRLPIIGFRVGQLAYITDAKDIPESTIELIRGVDTLVINALRHTPHLSHMNLEQALDVISRVSPRRAWLTHLSHEMGRHSDVEPTLPPGVGIAYDGLTIEIPTD
ncbi:MAG: UDP-N-acetylmuramate dehydrogenase [Pseudoflavonifractor sp.]|nr:UDP-N-acetylmuramate dehydrogenase [Pseudoflavonifractor sp.]